MLALIGNVIKLIYFILTWRVQVEEDKKKEKEIMAKEASDAIKSGSVSRINAVVNRLHK